MIHIDGTITVDKLTDGMKLLSVGHKRQAKRIHFAQKLRFPELVKKGWHKFNHVGDITKDKDNNVVIYEQDGLGKFSTSLVEEYIKEGKEIYIAVRPGKFDDTTLVKYRLGLIKYASDDSILNYSYKSLPNFLYNAIMFKLTGNEDKWIWNTEPKGKTCSQASAWFDVKYLMVVLKKAYWKVYPCEFAIIDNPKIYKLIF